jgi:menaquinone-dependent protoporphyrinogen oxidase
MISGRLFIIGSAVYDGRWLREAVDFVLANRATLIEHPVWLFSSGPVGRAASVHGSPEPKGIPELQASIKARGHHVFAGAFDPANPRIARLGRLDRIIAGRFVPTDDSRDWASIDSWAYKIGEDRPPRPRSVMGL